MVPKRLAAAASALALVAGVAHAQTKTPAQLTAQTSIASGDLFMVWPAASGGPLHQVQYGVLQSQLQAALGSTYLQVNNNLSDLNSPSLARGNLGLGALATEANPTSAQVTTGLGYTPLNKAGDTISGLLNIGGTTGVSIGSGAASGFYADNTNIAIRAENVSGSTIYFEPYNGSSVWGNINGNGFSLNVPVTAPGFSGPLTGTASNASQLGNESLATAATASSVAGRDASGNLTANTFYGALSGSASQLGGESLATAATPSTVAGRDSSGNLTAGTFNGALNGLAANSTALQGYTPTNTGSAANSIPVRDGSGNINAYTISLNGQIQVGPGANAGLYSDTNNVAIRTTSSTGTIYLQNSGGASIYATVSSGGVTANTFNGALNGNAATATTASTANAGASGFTIGGQPAAYVQSNGSGAGSISYGTAAPSTLAVGAIYLQTN